MFTGIVEAIGTIASVSPLAIEVASPLAGLTPGESVAVNGVCLTVASLAGETFRADLSEETLRRTALGRLEVGSAVNLERPMPADGRFSVVQQPQQMPGQRLVLVVLQNPQTVDHLAGGGAVKALLQNRKG